MGFSGTVLMSNIIINHPNYLRVSAFWNLIFQTVLLIHKWYKYICQKICHFFGQVCFLRKFVYLSHVIEIGSRNNVVFKSTGSGTKNSELNSAPTSTNCATLDSSLHLCPLASLAINRERICDCMYGDKDQIVRCTGRLVVRQIE